MAYFVAEECIRCKYMDCVEVCPVDCFHEGESMLVIDPQECISCGACEPQCPVNAIHPDGHDHDGQWLQLNADFASQWPTVTRKGTAPADADAWRGVADKFANHFAPRAAKTN